MKTEMKEGKGADLPSGLGLRLGNQPAPLTGLGAHRGQEGE